jgi:hypothetical protein
MFTRSAAIAFVGASLGLGTPGSTDAVAFSRTGGIPVGNAGGGGYQGMRFTFSHGSSTALPQMRCIPRQMRKLFALDPSADPDFVAATAAHLCGVRDAG